MTEKLPTKAVFEKAINDPARAKSLLLQCFHHGVKYLGGSEAVSDKSTKDAAAVLVQVWDAFPVELEGLLVDVVWFASSATSGDEPKTKALVEILSSLVAIPGRQAFWKQLQGTLNPSLLQACGLLSANDANTLTKKISKLNTEIYYKQQKYNLLQEQSEGYAKLLTILFGDLSDITPQVLREYMGAFDLDPNRVLEILLDLLDNHDRKDKILELMQEFSLAKLPNLLAFKLTHYRTSAIPIPPPLLRSIILLAEKGLLELKCLVPAAVEDMHACFALHETLLHSQISRLARISLTSDNGNRPDAKLQECQRLLQDGTTKLETQNVLVGLAHLLLLDQNWELAWTMMPNTEDWVQLCTLQPLKVGKELCQWVSTRILKVQEGPTRNVVTKSSDTVRDDDPVKENGNSYLETAEEVFESCYSALVVLGQSSCLSDKPTLYSNLCLLMRTMLQVNGSDKLSPTIYNLLRLVLVPTLSLLPPDPKFAADLWSVLSIIPYSTRYQLYRDWRGCGLERAGIGSKPLLQVQCEMEAGKAARYTLKRLSKDNIRDMGRQVSKVTHSNPLVVFSTILGQIESYDNLIQMMVETIRLVTPLSLDVLGYCVLTRLSGVGGVNRSRLKDDGVNVSQWLQSLEAFTGAFYRACPEVEFRGILSYLVHRLKTGHVLELGVLKTLIKSAGGYSFADYSPAASLSLSQLEGRAGSLLLKRETFAFGIVDNFDFHASDRVRSVLQGNDFGVTILILLAQTRVRLLFDPKGTKKKHVKLVANLLDTCQVVMYILLEFITDSSMSKLAKVNGKASKDTTNAIETYASSLPSINELFDVFKLDAVSAWMLCRPIFRAVLSGEKSEHFERHKGDRKKSARGMLPLDAWNHITPDLFDAFFSFSLYDIHFPENAYKTQLTRLKDTEQRLTNKKKNHKSGVHGLEFTAEDENALERVKASADALAEDMEKQNKHCHSIRKHIAAAAKTMFQSKEMPVTAMQTFITYCIYPRCKLNPDEATYCVRFITTLHALKTPGFSTMHFIDEFVKVLSGSLYSSTEDEAASIGILLLELWKVVSRWRYEDGSFEEEVAGTPGAVIVTESGNSSVSFDDYKVLYNKWHAAIGQATIGCLDSTEYMHVRSSFVVLSRIVDAFPTRPKLGQTLLDALEPLQDETYPLQDIKTAAHAYSTLLIKARGDGVWKEEDSATIKAREEKEKADIAAKLKRREEQLADMKRDMEKIDVEIGDSGRRDDRDTRRRGAPIDSNSRSDARRPIFEPPAKPQSSSTNVSRRDPVNDNGDRGRRSGPDADRTATRTDRQSDKQQLQESLEGRWERGQKVSGSAKRDRSPPPAGDIQPSSKRPRTEGRPPAASGSVAFEPPVRSGQRGGVPANPQQQRAERGGFTRRSTTRR